MYQSIIISFLELPLLLKNEGTSVGSLPAPLLSMFLKTYTEFYFIKLWPKYAVLCKATPQLGPRPPLLRSRDYSHLDTHTHGSTPLDGWSARCRDVADNTQHSQETVPAEFEPTIPASKQQQTHALDRAAIEIGEIRFYCYYIYHNYSWNSKGVRLSRRISSKSGHGRFLHPSPGHLITLKCNVKQFLFLS